MVANIDLRDSTRAHWIGEIRATVRCATRVTSVFIVSTLHHTKVPVFAKHGSAVEPFLLTTCVLDAHGDVVTRSSDGPATVTGLNLILIVS